MCCQIKKHSRNLRTCGKYLQTTKDRHADDPEFAFNVVVRVKVIPKLERSVVSETCFTTDTYGSDLLLKGHHGKHEGLGDA